MYRSAGLECRVDPRDIEATSTFLFSIDHARIFSLEWYSFDSGNPNGNLQFFGRNDHQVKIRGFRIELGDIEAKLAEHPLVHAAVAVAREDIPRDKRLVAYVYLAEDGGADSSLESGQTAGGLASILRVHLASRLPEYMIPKAFVKLDTVPMTPNGKLDRKALPAPDWDAYVRRTYEEPQSEVEKVLAALWQEITGAERVGGYDRFFELAAIL